MDRIRPAGPEDAPAMGRVHVRAWRETYPGQVSEKYLRGLDEEKSAARFLENGCAGTFVAEARGEIIGFVRFGRCRDEGAGAEVGEIYAIYLLQAAQKKGLGRALIEAAEEALRGAGFGEAVVWCLLTNGPAIGFYEKMGYRPGGEEKEFFLETPLFERRWIKKIRADEGAPRGEKTRDGQRATD